MQIFTPANDPRDPRSGKGESFVSSPSITINNQDFWNFLIFLSNIFVSRQKYWSWSAGETAVSNATPKVIPQRKRFSSRAEPRNHITLPPAPHKLRGHREQSEAIQIPKTFPPFLKEDFFYYKK